MSNRLPEELLQSLEEVEGFDKDRFIYVHESGEQVVSVRFNPLKLKTPVEDLFPGAEKIPWCSGGYYLPARPSFTLDPLLHAGVYYVQEASGMFIEQCVRQHSDLNASLHVLDLCGAPGGKSTLLHAIINSDSLLVSNEVIKTRASILVENMVKWGGANVVVTNNDPADFKKLPSFFDIIVVDAPCSGSGLFRRDPDAVGEWSTEAVNMCSLRQKRILHDVFDSLKPGGLLVYSTCSYSKEEDEDICDHLVSHFDVEPLEVKTSPDWNIVESHSTQHRAPGYRFFPDKLKGEGFFAACFRKLQVDEAGSGERKKGKLTKATRNEIGVAAAWLSEKVDCDFFSYEGEVLAVTAALSTGLLHVHAQLYLKKAGVRLGRVIGNDLVPHHELAVSGLASQNLQRVSLKREDALQYLRKEDVTLGPGKLGWALVEYKGYELGWVKMLGRRWNNYYPKDWRILKSGNN